ncbi:MAG: UMP kinase [candidate division WOR-3 bacterium]|nr:UMP kinase [candidate division WOR-3 bacterium]MCX7836607.1 UMP kinase [candidate division WOR-3 bacterium]MDW8113345.1 UMP kinase [candidate division WOR-3 bacterium]
MNSPSPYQRILLKLTGEIWEDKKLLKDISEEIIEAIENFLIKIAIVTGGGNFVRGTINDMGNRLLADRIGMLGTIINALIIEDYLKKKLPCVIFSSFSCMPIVEHYSVEKAKEALENGKIVILAGGTGNPYFSTDTACALRGRELKVDVILKGTKVEGVYSEDPLKNKKAKFYKKITYEEVIKKGLKIMDEAAFYILKEVRIPLIIYNGMKKGNLKKILLGEEVGSLIC